MYWLAIALCGAMGTLVRWWISIQLMHFNFLPLATLFVNLLGALLIGLIYGFASVKQRSGIVYAGITSGFLGAFTTMSAFGLEMWNLVMDEQWMTAFVYISLSGTIGPWFAHLGIKFGERWKAGL
jgi:CrcB protein